MSDTHDVIISGFALSRLEAELSLVTEQRDRLAEALESVMAHFSDIAGDCNDEAQREEELKSTELAEQALAAAKGGTP
jgi:hypothetical protein